MSAIDDTAKLTWRPITGLPEARAKELGDKLSSVLASWEGTPYMSGQQCKKGGADCVRFVTAVLEEVFGLEHTPIETLPPDSALHNREGAIASMKRIREALMPNDPVKDGSLEPGDVIVTGPQGGGPGHAMIVGPRPNELWHAAGKCVHRTGIGFLRGFHQYFRTYRLTNRG